MKSRTIMAALVAGVSLATLSTTASAQGLVLPDPRTSLSLPRPDFRFKGEVGRNGSWMPPAVDKVYAYGSTVKRQQ